jgi:hypothetical protein
MVRANLELDFCDYCRGTAIKVEMSDDRCGSNNLDITHSIGCPGCDEIIDAVETDEHSPAIIRCPYCGYSDVNSD